MKREDLLKAGHYEIHGETIAKFEFFQNGYNPYSRYLDTDKVDLILRRKKDGNVRYIEVQVKYGTLYTESRAWYTGVFHCHCWKFFKLDEFQNCSKDLYIALVLSRPNNYQGDLFVFPATDFHDLINKSTRTNTVNGEKSKFMIFHVQESNKWLLCTTSSPRNDKEGWIDVTEYRRNFDL